MKLFSKRYVFIAFLLLCVSISVTAVLAAPTPAYGDMDNDGQITALDVVLMARSVAGWSECTINDSQKVLADVNRNGKFDTTDIVISARHVAGWKGYEMLPFTPDGLGYIGVILEKGVNLEGLEDQNKSSTYMTKENTYIDIASKGFDHIRLPVNFRYYANSDGTVKSSFYTTLDTIIELANKNGLAVCLDFHAWHDFNLANGDDELFYAIWEDVATHYKDYDTTMLAFELINEPHTTEGGDLDATNLNVIQRKAVKIIREITPARTILLAVAEWNGSWKLPSYTLTEFDNVYVAVHTYSPLDFTHQGMQWMGTENVKIALDEYWHQEYGGTIATLKHDLQFIPAFQKRTGIKVILNEFGLNTSGDISDADVKLYLETIANYAEENDIAWTYWSYNGGDFALYYTGSIFGWGAKWREVPLNAIIPQG